MIIMPIHLVVVESHQHVLEHVHLILRRRLRQRSKRSRQSGDRKDHDLNDIDQDEKRNKESSAVSSSWSMLHFDSHPDLACPNANIPAAACFMPRQAWPVRKIVSTTRDHDESWCEYEEKNLYEFLDTSQGGIAEWIIPLVFAGGLDQVFWIKNEWCNQFLIGSYGFHVGAFCGSSSCSSENGNCGGAELQSFLDLPDRAAVKTSLKHPYYIDDDCYVPENNLLLKEKMELIVSEVGAEKTLLLGETNSPPPSESNMKGSVKDWILDVCLDYFYWSNPFLEDLQKINMNIANLFLEAVTETLFRQKVSACKGDLTEDQCVEYRSSLETFHSTVQMLLKTMVRESDKTSELDEDCTYFEILKYYPDPERAKVMWDELLNVLADENAYNASRDEVVKVMLEALPNLTLPHLNKNALGVSLVDNQLSPLLQLKVANFGDYLRSHSWMNEIANGHHFSDEPMLITMARSSDDGYTPGNIVEALQSTILNEIHSIYCDCGRTSISNLKDDNDIAERCNLNVIFDYGEYEGTSLEDNL